MWVEEKDLINAACEGKAVEQTPTSLETRLHTREKKTSHYEYLNCGKNFTEHSHLSSLQRTQAESSKPQESKLSFFICLDIWSYHLG